MERSKDKHCTRRGLFIGFLAVALIPMESEARGGCGSRGGPGYRKANGQCAGWNDYQDGYGTAAPRSNPKPKPKPKAQPQPLRQPQPPLNPRTAEHRASPVRQSPHTRRIEDICEPNSTCEAELKAQAEFNRQSR